MIRWEEIERAFNRFEAEFFYWLWFDWECACCWLGCCRHYYCVVGVSLFVCVLCVVWGVWGRSCSRKRGGGCRKKEFGVYLIGIGLVTLVSLSEWRTTFGPVLNLDSIRNLVCMFYFIFFKEKPFIMLNFLYVQWLLTSIYKNWGHIIYFSYFVVKYRLGKQLYRSIWQGLDSFTLLVDFSYM